MEGLAGGEVSPQNDRGSLPGESHSWRTLLAGSALFLMWGLVAIWSEFAIPRDGSRSVALLAASLLSSWLVFLLPTVVVGYAWTRNFPRWTYPYVGSTLLYTYFIAANMIAIPQTNLLANTSSSYTPWGWRAWIPLLLAIGIGLIITRSIRPLVRFFTNAWMDWTLLSYALFGWAPLFLLASFDEVSPGYTLTFIPILVTILVATAMLYLASRSLTQRAWFLFAGACLSLAITLVVNEIYWNGIGAFNAGRVMLILTIFLVVLFSPALIGVVQHFQERAVLRQP